MAQCPSAPTLRVGRAVYSPALRAAPTSDGKLPESNSAHQNRETFQASLPVYKASFFAAPESERKAAIEALKAAISNSDRSTQASDGASVASCSTDSGAETGREPKEAFIVFDWDDTLLPTTFLNAPGATATEEQLRSHARVVEFALREACRAARVCIVTLSRAPWVTLSAGKYLTGLDLPQLLEELDIKVYYAGDHAFSRPSEAPTRRAEGQYLKRQAMAYGLATAYAEGVMLGYRLNVMSIGDSVIEQLALKELLETWEQSSKQQTRPLCKTVQLRMKPSLQELKVQLLTLSGELGRLARCDRSFDVSLPGSLDLSEHLGRLGL